MKIITCQCDGAGQADESPNGFGGNWGDGIKVKRPEGCDDKSCYGPQGNSDFHGGTPAVACPNGLTKASEIQTGLAEEAHQAGGGEVGDEEALSCSGGGGDLFGGDGAAADGAFHGGGPAGGSPVAGEEDAGPRGGGGGAVAVDSGRRGEGGVDLFDYGGFDQGGGTGGGEKFFEFPQCNIDDFLAGFVAQGFGGADDELDVAGRCTRQQVPRLLRSGWQ